MYFDYCGEDLLNSTIMLPTVVIVAFIEHISAIHWTITDSVPVIGGGVPVIGGGVPVIGGEDEEVACKSVSREIKIMASTGAYDKDTKEGGTNIFVYITFIFMHMATYTYVHTYTHLCLHLIIFLHVYKYTNKYTIIMMHIYHY
jgi:hypothetical protein